MNYWEIHDNTPVQVTNTVSMPLVVGYWEMPGGNDAYYFRFAVYKEPSWLHKKLMRLFLGWVWRETK